MRLVALDRPGYGGSDPVVAAVDAAAVLEKVLPAGATAGVAGWSSGGRVVLAALRPDLVGRVAVIGTLAPDEEVPWYGGNRGYIDLLRGASAGGRRRRWARRSAA